VIEFGTRRAHGMESGVLAARAAVIGGCQELRTLRPATSSGFLSTARRRIRGLWRTRTKRKLPAISQYFPRPRVLLVDTYDVRAALEKIISWAGSPEACASIAAILHRIARGSASGWTGGLE